MVGAAASRTGSPTTTGVAERGPAHPGGPGTAHSQRPAVAPVARARVAGTVRAGGAGVEGATARPPLASTLSRSLLNVTRTEPSRSVRKTLAPAATSRSSVERTG